MKIYPNDLCPCGSGKKYKNCCIKKDIKQIGMMGALPIECLDNDADFFVDKTGAVLFRDESKQPVLEISEGSIIKNVLSVGFTGTLKPTATIQEDEGAICYLLPDWYLEWCQFCVFLSMKGLNLFPSDVEFALNNGKYSADIL